MTLQTKINKSNNINTATGSCKRTRGLRVKQQPLKKEKEKKSLHTRYTGNEQTKRGILKTLCEDNNLTLNVFFLKHVLVGDFEFIYRYSASSFSLWEDKSGIGKKKDLPCSM